MNKLPVVKVVIQAPTTSFRYPHFLIGRQPTFDMPPPSTIYGHVASALGELPPPDSFRFGYDFRFASKAKDLEHQHIITAASKRSGASVEVTVQPHWRDFLFKPQLTLYLDNLALGAAFRSPVFCVILGRSQDLAEIVSVEDIELEEQAGAYFVNTLLPFSYRPSVGFGVTVLMPRFIEPPPERRAHFERFIALRDVVYGGEIEARDMPRRLILRAGQQAKWWVDPRTPKDRGVHRAVVFHSCAIEAEATV